MVGAIAIAAWQLSKRGSPDVTSPVVTVDSIEPIAQRDVEVRMREAPPDRCFDVEAIRMVRAHVVMTVDREPMPFARDEDSHRGKFRIAGRSVTTDARGTFTLRLERGELVRIDRTLA